MTNSETFSGGVFPRKFIWLLILAVFLIYLLYPTKNFYWDGIYFASLIEDAPALDTSLFHPNHLFYNVIGYLAYRVPRIFGVEIRAVYVLQFISSVFGAASAIVFFFILRRILKNDYLGFALTALFAFSATWWKFAADANAYIPSVFFLLIAFYSILPDQPPRPFLTALAHSAAMFLHELAVLFFPVVILGIIFQTISIERRRRVILILQYWLATFFLTFGTFCLCFYLTTDSFEPRAFFRWLTSYSPDIGFTLNVWNNLGLTLRGTVRLFVDGRFNFFEFDWLNIILAIFLGIALVRLIVKLTRSGGDFKAIGKAFRDASFYRHPVTILCAAWISAYLIFLFFFIPGNTFYRLFYLPALILVFGVLIVSSEISKNLILQKRLALFVVVIALCNFLFFIRPYSKVLPNTPLALALNLNQQWSDKTVVYYKSLNSDNRLVRYFNPATVWKPLETTADFEKSLQEIRQSGEPAWVETSAIDWLTASEETARRLAGNSDAPPNAELNTPAYRLKFVRLVPKPVGD